MKRFNRKIQEAVESEEEAVRLKIYEAYGVDLTEKARNGELEPVVGRNNELNQVIWILGRKTKNNPILIGEPGVGKTAAVEKLAQIIADGDCPDFLRDKKIISIDINKVLGVQGAYESLIQEVATEGLILFMDEIHTLAKPIAYDALKPALARGTLSLIGATTLGEYRESIEKDGAMERRFQKIFVDEPNFLECLEILNGVKNRYGDFHNVIYTDEALESFIKLSQRYITDRFLPDKAIDLMDETGAKIRMSRTRNPKIIELEKALIVSLAEVANLAKKQKFEESFDANAEVKRIQDELIKLNSEPNNEATITITKELVEEVVAKKTRIPIEKISKDSKQSLKGLQGRLKTAVIGQDEAIDSITRIIKRTKAGLKDPNRPEGVFLFLGPTGVGKTYLVKQLAKEIFGDENRMFRLDMGEFSESHTVSKLFGSPPGYVGYGDGNQFTEKIRRNPHSIVLLDEMEKAHPKVLQAFLQVFEDGIMTDGQGRKVDFKNTVIIMTSNIGAKAQQLQPKSVGFSSSSSPDIETQRIESFQAELKKALSPEFINRIDEIIIFNDLEKEAILQIVDVELRKVAMKLKEKNIEFTWGDSIKELLIQQGFNKEMGARPLRRAVQKFIEDPIANAIIDDDIEEKIHIEYNATSKKLVINGNEVNERYRKRINTKYKLFENMETPKYSKKIMKFESFLAAAAPSTSPVRKPKEEPDFDPEPVKPVKPVNPEEPIKVPSVNPGPMAKKKFSELDVVNRFEMLDKRKSRKKL